MLSPYPEPSLVTLFYLEGRHYHRNHEPLRLVIHGDSPTRKLAGGDHGDQPP